MRFAWLFMFCFLTAHASTLRVTGQLRAGAIVGHSTPYFYTNLDYAESPIDNPLKGFTWPRSSGGTATNHSMFMEMWPMKSSMTDSNTFNWDSFDSMLDLRKADGFQTIPRVYLDLPGSTDPGQGIPQYLIDGGLITTNYGQPPAVCPDYTDVNLRYAMTNFIAHFGARYDGDARIAFMHIGFLGHYGEWQVSRLIDEFGVEDGTNWWAKLPTQQEILDAHNLYFTKTKLEHRYPSGTNSFVDSMPMLYNGNMPMGYFDDSFSWLTLGTAGYYFSTQLTNANAQQKWRYMPIGGEVNDSMGALCGFDNPPCTQWDESHTGIQNFTNCIAQMHTTHSGNWALASGTATQKWQIVRAAHMMGYELWIQSLKVQTNLSDCVCDVTVTNTAVAPFYYNWQIEIAATNSGNFRVWAPNWALTNVIPGDGSVVWSHTMTNGLSRPFTLLMRCTNAMAGGKPIRFANANMHATWTNWLTLGLVP